MDCSEVSYSVQLISKCGSYLLENSIFKDFHGVAFMNFNPPYTILEIEIPKLKFWQTVETKMNNAAFHQDLHCLLRSKQYLGTDVHYNLKSSTCGPLKYTMSRPIIIVSICVGKSIRYKRSK